MKIARFELKAYGHFTDVSLDFTSATPGLHIVFGPNEAGKSTALRALRRLLYGIPLQTGDNFLHDYSKLLIGGCLENADGRRLTFWRRKRNVGDLLDADFNVMEPSMLAEFLHGIEEPLFNTLFGIDHETLVSGGRDILEQKGDVGQALFSAGAGLSALHGVIEELEKEYAALFKPGGSRPELNQAIKAYQELKKEIRGLSLSAAVWKAQQEAFESASRELEVAAEEKLALQSEMERLKRLQLSIPHLAKRAALQKKLVVLGELGHLPADFSARVAEAFDRREKAARRLEDARSRKGKLEHDQAACAVDQAILDQAETIQVLNESLGVYRQSQNDRPALQDERLRLEAEAQALLDQAAPALDLSRTDAIKSLLARRQNIVTLGNRFDALREGLDEARQRGETAVEALAGVDNALACLPPAADPGSLSAAVTTAQNAGNLDDVVRQLEREVEFLKTQSAAALKSIGLWQGMLEELSALPLPAMDTLDRFAEAFRELEGREKARETQFETLQHELDRVGRDISVMEKAGRVATEDDLVRARAHRDHGWQLVRRAWLGGEDIRDALRRYDETRALPEAFEASVRAADDIADRLRSAAGEVHQYASLLGEAEKLEAQRLRLDGEAETLAARREGFEADWRALWAPCAVEPLPPREMRAWVEQCQSIRRDLQAAAEKLSEQASHRSHRESLRQALSSALRSLNRTVAFKDEALAPILAHAKETLAEIEAIEARRAELQKERRRLTHDSQAAEKRLAERGKAMADWQKAWSSALAGFALAEDAEPREASDALDRLRSCLEKRGQAESLARRIEAMDAHAEKFRADVTALVESVAPQLSPLPADQAVVKLQSLLKEAVSARSLKEKLAEGLEGLAEEMRQATLDFEEADRALAALRELVRCDSDEALLDTEGRFTAFNEANKALAEVEETLMGIAPGVALEALERERREIDPDRLAGRIEALNREITEELEPRIKELYEKRGEARSELQRMDGSDKASAKEDEAQAVLAKIRRLADRYLRVRLAALLLKREIDRYRKAHQDPILKIAARYFSELTLGAFPGLRADVDEGGHPILVSLRPDGGTRTVEEMSTGTRDQLYLALRLATLEWRLEKHEAMPFIADDILVNFDDSRSEATLKALASLGEKNQVILFTHHRQIVRTAEAQGRDGHVVVHRLGTVSGE